MKGENSLTTKETKEVFENKDTTEQKHLNQKDREKKTADLRKDDLKHITPEDESQEKDIDSPPTKKKKGTVQKKKNLKRKN